MRRILLVLSVAALMAAMMAVGAGPILAAPAGPKPNNHNCGGTSSFESTLGPGGGRLVGKVVSGIAPSGDIPLFTHANCDTPPGER